MAKFTVKPPWWWRDGDEAEEAFFNKRWLSFLRCGGYVLLLLLSFSGHGGSDWVWKVATPCGIGGVWGDALDHELIQARGNLASAISCRHGGEDSTSDER
jgi:hypothetical protein